MESKQGGGCVALLGLPFFVMGLLVSAAAMNLIPAGIERLPIWAPLVVMSGGLLVTLVGAGLLFGRGKTVIDESRGVVNKEFRFCKISVRNQEFWLRDFSGLLLRFSVGNGDTQDLYEVLLEPREKGRSLLLFQAPRYETAREQSAVLADFLSLPLNDTSGGPRPQ